ncbi:hypothetical protein F4861DRAFT_537785 [Xylaria intraflava]|nr:hypothetical protein F4861DRAFT_537785 [Xylaria intraflava]
MLGSAALGPIKDPLADALGAFRLLFNLIHKNDPVSIDDSIEIDRLEQDKLRDSAIILLLALDTLAPADTLKAHLETLRSSITSDSSVDCFKLLFSAALADKPDSTLIWDLVSQAAANIITPTRPTAIPSRLTAARSLSGLDDTPVGKSTSSLQSSEQIWRLLQERVFEEIQDCTYRDGEGFFKKYFEGRDWTDRAQKVYESVKQEHSNGEWVKLRGSPDEKQVKSWLFQLSDNFLSNEIRRYYTVSMPKELTGGEAARQIDLLVKRKCESDIEHNWKDIQVIGGLRQSSKVGVKGPLLQLARYARDVFSCQPTRRFLHAFTICGRKMEAWVFDRSGPYSAGSFDIHKHPERFICVLAGYIMMSDDELGLDTFIHRENGSCFININWDGIGMKRSQLKQEPLTYQRSIVSRGTCCYLVRDPDSDPKASDNWDYVAKFSWPPKERRPEADFLRLANERGVQGVARLVGHHSITSIGDMRSGMTFTRPYRYGGAISTASSLDLSSGNSRKRQSEDDSANQRPKRLRSNDQQLGLSRNKTTWPAEKTSGSGLLFPSNGPYSDREFRCLVTYPAGRPIYTHRVRSTEEAAADEYSKEILDLLTALRDAIKAHKSLYEVGRILHRDISENNIIITDPEKTGFSGMLIDLDLAKELGTGRSGAHRRTGTMQFMAIGVLQGASHTYRHDLESFFYVLVWCCIRHGWKLVKRESEWGYEESLLNGWYSGSFMTMAGFKRGYGDRSAFELILSEFPEEFDRLKPLCRDLRSILFPRYNESLYIGTPKDLNVLYGPIVDAFDKAIDEELRRDGDRVKGKERSEGR